MSGITLSDGSVLPSDTVNSLAGGANINMSTISSSSQLLSMSTDEIAALVAQIDRLIKTQNDTIISTQKNITMLQASIDNPVTGYQARYKSTMKAYSTSVYNYIAQSSLVVAASARLNSLNSTLSSVLLEEQADISTMNGYAQIYSTFILQIQANDSALSSELNSYNTLSTTMGSLVNDYMIKMSSLQNTTDPATASTLSTAITNNRTQQIPVNTFIQSTLQTISTMSFISTNYQNDLNNYGTDSLYSALKNRVFSTIEQLWAEQARLTSSISNFDRSIFLLQQSTMQEFTQLGGQINTFYTDKSTQIQNQILKVKYSVQEWESFFGYVISQCMITKLQVYNTIDLLTYQIQQTPDSSKSAAINKYFTDQATMQLIIDALNPLITNISDIYQTITTELALRSTFIGNYQQKTMMELNVFSSPGSKASYSTTYPALLNTIAGNVTNINASIGLRSGKIQTLIGTFDNINTSIQYLRGTNTNIYPNLSFLPPDRITAEVPFGLNMSEFEIPGLDIITFP